MHWLPTLWAASDARAANSLRRSERVVLEFLTSAFHRLGFNEEQGELRARMLVSLNVVDFDGVAKADTRSFLEQALKLLLKDAPN